MSPVTLSDISLKGVGLTPRVRHLRDLYFRSIPEICTDRPELITTFSTDLFEQRTISILDKAKLYARVLGKRKAIVRHARAYEKGPEGMKPFEFKDPQLFAGSTTSKFKGVPLYPEFLGLALWPELVTVTKRERNPYYIAPEDIEKLNHEIFPSWINRDIMELARERCNIKARQKIGFGKPLPDIVPLDLMERVLFFLDSKVDCISHTIPDFSRAINEGLGGIIQEALRKEIAAADKAQKEFYAAIAEVLQGVITYSHRLAEEAMRLADQEPDPIAKKELLEIEQIYRWVPENKARNFREGLTTIWVCWTAIHLENPNIGLSLGRLDQVLYPLYLNDIEHHHLDVENAIELLCCLWLKMGDHVPLVPESAEQLFGGNGSNQAITIGGVDKDGNDVVNDLTYLILRSIELMKLRDPNLNARYYPGVNRPQYLARLCEANINTGATPAIHNDPAAIKALIANGDPPKFAMDYGIVGCVEPTSSGRTYGATAAILLNLTSALELTLFNGRHRNIFDKKMLDKRIGLETGETFNSFPDFLKAFRRQIAWIVCQATTLNKILEETHRDFYPTPILSALFEGPMEKGKDLIEGGAKINPSGASIIGLADVADSLSAIEKVVFDEKAISFGDLLEALKKNFKGYEALRLRLLNPDKTPKYGNEDPQAEANAKWIMKLLSDIFKKRKNTRGGRFRVGYWTMTNHAGFGKLMKAFPNGRGDHENFTSGITPVSGVTPYLTKVLNSVAGKPAGFLSNGVALNLKFPLENGCTGSMVQNLANYIDGYFDDLSGKRDGGLEIQFNIVDYDRLVEAFNHPEKNPELLVRVSGYTAYFKDLSPQMQREIIDRTEYLLSSGTAVFHQPIPVT